jgi:hypothetical protein
MATEPAKLSGVATATVWPAPAQACAIGIMGPKWPAPAVVLNSIRT